MSFSSSIIDGSRNVAWSRTRTLTSSSPNDDVVDILLLPPTYLRVLDGDDDEAEADDQ